MASLIKHKSGWYYAQFYDKYRRPTHKRVSLSTRRKRTAERALAKLEEAYVLGQYWRSYGGWSRA